MVYTLCIIGMGISGISVARWAKYNNINTIILEKNPSIGGCWLEKSYPNVILQTTKYSYSYSDFPMPDHYPLYPTRKNVLDYLYSYCKLHKLFTNAQFNSTVTKTFWSEIEKCWFITYNQNNLIKKIKTKYLCVCSGFYTTPKIPQLKNKHLYSGEICHNNEWGYLGNKNKNTFNNKKVLVVGNGPSGCDLACLAVKNGAKDVTLLYRSPRWIFMRKISIISLHFILNRTFLWIGNNIPEKLFLIILYIIYYIPFYLKKYKMNWTLPNKIITRKNLTLNEEIFNYINNDKIKYIHGTIEKFTKNALEIKKK